MSNFTDRLDGLLEKATKGPYFVAGDEAADCPPHKNSGLAMIDTGRVSDWPFSRLCEWHDANLIAYLVNHAPAIRDLVVAAEMVALTTTDSKASKYLREALTKLEEE